MKKTHIVKRDGTKEKFDQEKIERVIDRVFTDTDNDIELSPLVIEQILNHINETSTKLVSTEEINDHLQRSLMECGFYDEAAEFILYREKNKNIRMISADNKAMSDYIFMNRYARYIPRKKRRETWNEAVDRVRDMHIRKYSQLETEITWAFEQVRQKRVLPSMRSMQFAGDPIENNNARLYNCSYGAVDRISFFSEAIYLLLCGCGVGFSVELQNISKLPIIQDPDNKTIKHVEIEDSIEGWSDTIKELMNSYVYGYTVEFIYKKIRVEGSKIKSGGNAPGHVPLRRAVEKIRTILDNSVGRKLKPIEAYDIVMHSADAVLAGGVRRSACICMFSPEDDEMMNAKTGNWFEANPQRARSNNSVKLVRDETSKDQFMRIFEKQKEFGEPGFYFVDDKDHGSNPCFHRDTKILTSNGWETIGAMYNNDGDNIVAVDKRVGKGDIYNSKEFGVQNLSASHVELTHKSVDLYKVITDNGNEIITTPNHKFITIEGRKRLDELELGDKLPVMSGKGSFGKIGSYEEGLTLGVLCGDGTITKHHGNGVAYVDYWYKDDVNNKEENILDIIQNFIDTKSNEFNKTDRKYKVDWHNQTAQNGFTKLRIGGERLFKYITSLGITSKHDIVEYIFSGNEDMVRGYIQGLFLADGSVQCSGSAKSTTVSVRLTQNNDEFLRNVQILLNNFGVVSKLYSRRPKGEYILPDGKGGEKLFECKEVFELIISRPNAVLMEKEKLLVGNKLEKLEDVLNFRGRDCRKPERYITKVVSIEYYCNDDVFCLTQPDTNSVIANGISVGQCVEIGLNPFIEKNGEKVSGFAFCNLTTMNGKMLKSKEDFEIAVKASAIIGTCQAGYTDFKYLSKETKEITEREALLGMSITGIMDSPKIALDYDMQKEMSELAKEENKRISELIGINQAARITCVKPEGSTSILLDTASGIHPRYADKYFRRIQANINDPVYKFFKEQNPHCCEPSVYSVNKTDDVITFCVKAPDGAICKDDIVAIDFLEIVKKTQENWVLNGNARPDSSPGLNHNVSNTVTVKEDEWDEVADYIYDNREYFTGISLLGAESVGNYAQAPHEQIQSKDDEITWSHIVDNYINVDYVGLNEEDDNTKLAETMACGAGGCEVK